MLILPLKNTIVAIFIFSIVAILTEKCAPRAILWAVQARAPLLAAEGIAGNTRIPTLGIWPQKAPVTQNMVLTSGTTCVSDPACFSI